MTERLRFHFSLSCIGEGNGNPLQYSCLENPRDGEAWWASVYGVAQSRTQLTRVSSSSKPKRSLEKGEAEERPSLELPGLRKICVCEIPSSFLGEAVEAKLWAGKGCTQVGSRENLTPVWVTWKWKSESLGCVQLCVTPWTVAHQAPLSMEFSRQEYWSG